jgi:hypothetical protein
MKIPAASRKFQFSPTPGYHFAETDMLLAAKNAGLKSRALGLDDSRTYRNNCLHSLKAMLLEAKKDARLKPAATFAGAEILVRGSRMGRAGFSVGDIERASDLVHAND